MKTFEGYEIKNTILVSKSEAVMFGVNKDNVSYPYAVIVTVPRQGHKGQLTYVASESHNYAESVYLFAQQLARRSEIAMKEQATTQQQQGGMQL